MILREGGRESACSLPEAFKSTQYCLEVWRTHSREMSPPIYTISMPYSLACQNMSCINSSIFSTKYWQFLEKKASEIRFPEHI